MSRQNVELVQRAIEAFNAREVPEDVFAPDLSIETVATAVTDQRYEGRDGVWEWFDDFFGVLRDDARLVLEEVIDAGGDRVVAVHRLVGRGSASDLPFDLRWASICSARGGQLARIVGYPTRRKALEAAGLSQQPCHEECSGGGERKR